MKYKKGLIIGLIVGILSVPLTLLGLGSKIGLLFYPLIILPKIITFGYPSIPILIMASITIYSLLGFTLNVDNCM